MKNILTLMDLTEISNNALSYALHRFPNDNHNVLHIVENNALHEREYLQDGLTRNEVIHTEINRNINLVKAELKYGNQIYSETIQGNFLNVVKGFIQERGIDAIVMGTRDKYNLFDKWIGTAAHAVVMDIDLPTFLVPKFGKHKKSEDILVASDHQLIDPALTQQLITWKANDARFIHFLHIKNNMTDHYDEEKQAITKELLREGDPKYSFEIDSIYSKDTANSLLACAYNEGADLLVVYPEQRSSFKSILFESTSKELIIKATIPLLFIH